MKYLLKLRYLQAETGGKCKGVQELEANQNSEANQDSEANQG
jgi:hypothetical protein